MSLNKLVYLSLILTFSFCLWSQSPTIQTNDIYKKISENELYQHQPFFTTNSLNEQDKNEFYNYQQDLEEYQDLKLIRNMDFILHLGIQFSHSAESNSLDNLKNEINALKDIINSINPSNPYVNGVENSSAPFGFSAGFDIYYFNFGLGFKYTRNNFFRNEVSINRDKSQEDYHDYNYRYLYNMSGNSFLFNFLYRFPLLLQTPENNIYIVLGAGYNYNYGDLTISSEHSFIDNNDNIKKTSTSKTFSNLSAHGAHFILEGLFKLDVFVIATGVNWKILTFKNSSTDHSLFNFTTPNNEFSLNLNPLIYLKLGFTF